MSIEPTFKTHIASAVTPTPVYMNIAPAGVSGSYIVQRMISKGDREMGITATRIQLDIFGATYAAVKDLSVLVTAAIRTFDGADTFAPYRVNEMETYEQETNQHRVILDAMLNFDERPNFDS